MLTIEKILFKSLMSTRRAMLPLCTSLRCLLRVWFIGAAMTTRGMQHIGLLYAVDPGLCALHTDPYDLRLARQRYLGHVNIHPMMAPILLGLLLSLESLVATQKMPAQNMQRLINTTAETFSAIGDSFFSGTLLVFWALVATHFIIYDYSLAAIIWTLFLLTCLLLFRIYFFILGLKHGLMMLTKLGKLGLVNQARRLKIINTLLIVSIYWSVYNNAGSEFLWIHFLWGAILLGLGAILIGSAHMPRVFLVSIAFCVLSLYWFKPHFF